ncbi:MAG TPA: rhodanese-like domain-containing protein [Lacunisphaera sp.]|nr:rhodanese-like domain-containing protein [Lacunisphaera sp.]
MSTLTPPLTDTAGALEYFENKVAFTTGPIELDRARKAGDLVVVDVRAAEDYAAGHIPGAISLPENKWSRFEGLSHDKLNVLCCYSQVCHLAARAAVKFAAQGYPVQELEGGFKGWAEHQLEIER